MATFFMYMQLRSFAGLLMVVILLKSATPMQLNSTTVAGFIKMPLY